MPAIPVIVAPTVRIVQPTGDVSQDTAVLAQALDDLAYDPLAPEVGTLLLAGSFTINAPLVSGGSGKKVVCVQGLGSARLHYRGPRTTEPMLTFTGSTRHRVSVCANIRLDCQLNARGIAFQALPYQTLAQNLYVYNSRQIGLHMEDCDGSSLTDCMIEAFAGCGIVTPRCNALRISSLRCGTQWGCWYAGDSPTSNRSQGVRDYEMAYGRAAAQSHYAEFYASDWPVDVPPDDLGVAVLKGNGQELTNLVFERCRPCEYPLLRWNASASRLSGLYCEANQVRRAPLSIVGQPPGNGFGTACVRIEQLRHGYASQSEPLHPALVELVGTTACISVADANLARFAAVVDARQGHHTEVVVERVKSIYPTLAPDQWIAFK